MKIKSILMLLLIVCAALAHAIESKVTIQEIPIDSTLMKLPAIPWVMENIKTWSSGAPVFEIRDENAGTSAQGWFAVTEKNILVKIIVNDDVHENHKSGEDIWNGDAIQFGIDARGDSVGSLPRGMAFTGPDDASITFALTDSGPKAWAHYHGRPGGVSALPQLTPNIVRDEKAKTTTYNLVMPWQEFQTRAGIFPVIGFAIQLNDVEKSNSTRLYWGDGAGGALRPGLFHHLAIGNPGREYVSALGVRNEIWRVTGYGEIIVAVNSDQPCLVKGLLESTEQVITLPARQRRNGIRRFSVQGYPGLLPTGQLLLEATVYKKERIVFSEKINLTAPGNVIEDFISEMETLAQKEKQPVFKRHLNSTLALVQTQWAQAALQFDDNPQLARDVIHYVSIIRSGLKGDAVQWQTYLDRRRSLVLAFISPSDNTLQYYNLLLPRGWNPGQNYPMVVDLHGAGNPHTLNNVANSYAALTAGIQREEFPGEAEPFILMPWGRGNRGYQEYARNDVYEAIEDMAKTFMIDNKRVYLTGHSMGGGGAWAFALRHPDMWAAVAICSGGTWYAPTGRGMGGNLYDVPIRIWHGDSDNAVPVTEAYRMAEELKKYGVNPNMVIVPGGGHEYPEPARRTNLQWLLQFTRTRPDSFSFVVDNNDLPAGRNGVYIERDLTISALPRFTCKIEGNIIRIHSFGTKRVVVIGSEYDDGLMGIGLQGTMTVFLNDTEVYNGPVKTVSFDTGL
ncbi:MAG TPA: prolyl oligopeptidase family serine peptidase [bacterium]|mgnify:CR=1 FL=1|nr:prolyl oligopeptidase family serine peptidase [bacterium]HPN45868.1 prolyl oligopeptidase family serine peptidase [bacterium]